MKELIGFLSRQTKGIRNQQSKDCITVMKGIGTQSFLLVDFQDIKPIPHQLFDDCPRINYGSLASGNLNSYDDHLNAYDYDAMVTGNIVVKLIY